jgi:hypothetical protein
MQNTSIRADSASELAFHLAERLARKVYDFQLIDVGNGLILRGRCPSYYDKQMAQHAVMNATSLRIVANEIEVIAGTRVALI